MSTTEYTDAPRPDDDAVRRAKAEIRGIVGQIADLARSDAAPERFYDEFLNKVVAALAAIGGAVWTLSDTGVLQLAYQIDLRRTGLAENPIGQAQHGRLLTRTLTTGEGALVAPHSGATGGIDTDDENAAANPTDFLLVLAPVHNDQGVQGVVEVFQRPDTRHSVQQGYLKFLLQTCDLAGDYLRARRLSHLAQKQSLWEQLESFTRTAHGKLDVKETAFTIANEGRRLIGCDRVSVAVQKGSRMTMEAISGQDAFDKRSNVATLLTRAARAVARTGEDVWYSGDASNLAPQVEKALDAYVDESHTKGMAILPLLEAEDEDAPPEPGQRRKPPKVYGALIVEQMVDSQEPEGFRQRVAVVRSHGTTAIANALEHESLFLMPLWKTLGKATWFIRGSRLPKTVAVLTLLTGLTLAGVFVHKDFTVQADGEFLPDLSRKVFAQVGGVVTDVKVHDDDVVTAGQTVAVLRNIELANELTGVLGEISTAEAQIESLNFELSDRAGLDRADIDERQSRISQIQRQLSSLEQRRNLLREKQTMLTITSPIAGRVITYKVEDVLAGRPVNTGDELMEIADPTGPWRVEVNMPDKRMGHIRSAWQAAGEKGPDEGSPGGPSGGLEVTFHARSHPEETFTGRVIEIGQTAEPRGEEGNTVRLVIDFDKQALFSKVGEPKVGEGVRAKVHCGQQSILYCYFHDLIYFVQSNILFWF
ncbi:HlyD family efflux transporter periplasmic adaptor subunit [Pirellulimonas nuda]|uniref:HlyD family efflux transporter periplasmic adaptor subunit n=1 Tax=Pirellulimonas nuda TaxID=2528009 RepID=UPI0011A838F4|nr:HlyD family secretion protein [Pirellulimonas nuda]